MDYLLLPSSPHQEFRNRQPQWSRLNNSKKKNMLKNQLKQIKANSLEENIRV